MLIARHSIKHFLRQIKPSKLRYRQHRLERFIRLAAIATLFFNTSGDALALESWEKLDKRLKTQVYHLNVGLKMQLKNGLWVQLTDLSPKYRYPIFGTTADDRGFRVTGTGTAFPIKTTVHDKTFFLTNRHVVEPEQLQQLAKESERFYAAMRLAAERTANGKDVDTRFKEILATVNLSMKKNMTPEEKKTYTTTVDGIWDFYETYLSIKADPGRLLFQNYLNQVGINARLGYFLHKAGSINETPLEASVYKSAKSDSEPDLALLQVSTTTIIPLEFDTIEPSEGQEIQVIGYPTASDQIDADSSKYYAPTFSTGRISRVAPRILQVDAPITNGNSGGPVVSLRGKVLGVVAVRARSDKGVELNNFGGAVTTQSVQNFAPELFHAVR
jgi:S1-C subfamily serine protease